jgi:hypothetical protein
VYYAKIVVRVLMHSPQAEGYFGILHAKCNIIVIIMLTVHTMNSNIWHHPSPSIAALKTEVW